MAGEEIIRMLVPIVLLVIAGAYLLTHKDNAYSKALSRDKYDPEKVSTFLK